MQIYIKGDMKITVGSGEIVSAEKQITYPAVMGLDVSGNTVEISPAQMDYVIIPNPSEEDLIANGWVLYEDSVDDLRNAKLIELEMHGSSSDVNIFHIKVIGSGAAMGLDEDLVVSTWLSSDARLEAQSLIELRIENNDEYVSYTLKDLNATLKLEAYDFLAKIKQLRLYASDAQEVEELKGVELHKLTDVSAISNYDVTSGFPEPPVFEINLSDITL